MNRIDDFKKWIRDWLIAKYPTYPIYSEDIPVSKTFPRISYRVTSSSVSMHPREDLSLSLEIHDTSTNTTTIDNMTGDIIGDGNNLNATGLDHKAVSGDHYAFHIYLDNRNETLTSEEYTRQRNLNFNVKLYNI